MDYSSLPESVWNHGYEPISRNQAFEIFNQSYESILHHAYHWFLDSQKLPGVTVRFDFDVVNSEMAYFMADKRMLVMNVRSILNIYSEDTELTYVFLETLFHELFHYWQAVTYGLGRMITLNLLFNGGSHDLYHQNPLEIEARSFASIITSQYLDLLEQEDL